MTEQRHKEAIKRLVDHPGNNECSECFMSCPSYCSLTLGIFLCPVCAKLHQKLIPNKSEVVSILNHKWSKEEVDFLYTEGNKIVNAKYEKHLPIYYHRPRPDDPSILFEQWILAKYVRGEFQELSQQSAYNQGSKTGALFKRMKDQEKFQRRKFILNEPDGKLLYFIKYSDKSPKDVIPIRTMVNVYLVPEKVGNDNGMQFTYEKDGVRRNLFVFGEDAKSTTDWYHAIRASMARHKYKAFPDADVRRYLNTTIIMEGWMTKTGPKKHEKFRRRWFSLIGTNIWYSAQPLDAHPLGYIALGSKTFGYGVIRGFPKGIREEGYGLTIHTPGRVYVLNCSNMESRENWANHVEQVLTSCTNVWTKPEIMRLGNEAEKVINLDDVDDLEKPSSMSIFTEMPKNEPKTEQKEKVINLDDIDDLDSPTGSNGTPSEFAVMPAQKSPTGSTSSSEPRKPLFQKNTRSGQRKEGNIAAKANIDKKPRHGGTIKITEKEAAKQVEDKVISGLKAMEARAGSKKYSDDSDSGGSGSDGEIVHASPASTSPSSIHKQMKKLVSDEQKERRRITSSATDEDSEEEIVVIRRRDNDDQSISRRGSAPGNNVRHSFPRINQTSLLPGEKSPRSQSPLARPRSILTDDGSMSPGRTTPKKPPRRNLKQQDSDTTSNSSDMDDAKASDFEVLHRKHFHFSQETLNQTLLAAMPELTIVDDSQADEDHDEKQVPPTETSKNLLMPDADEDWRSNTFTSERRVQGKERKTLKRVSRVLSNASGDGDDEVPLAIPPRPIDLTISNNTEEGLWFMLFQSEEDWEGVDSYVTPWLGAEIAEMPASVGPIRLPSEFEIAVIDTAPGGYGLQRTTGPFYAEPGDVWEVDMPVDDGSAPDMYYHEGMETEDGSVIVHSNVENSKRFEVALFKSGRKLFCRKNIKPGGSVNFKVKQSLYVMPVNQESYYEMEGEDMKASDIIPKSSPVELNFKMPKLKVSARRRGETIFFSSRAAFSFKK